MSSVMRTLTGTVKQVSTRFVEQGKENKKVVVNTKHTNKYGDKGV